MSIPNAIAHWWRKLNVGSCSPASTARYSSTETSVFSAICSTEYPMISRISLMRAAISIRFVFASVFMFSPIIWK